MAFISVNKGHPLPDWQPERKAGYSRDIDAHGIDTPGYAYHTHYFHQWNQASDDINAFGFKLPVIPADNRPSLWWLVKLYPGELQHMHYDPYLTETRNPAHYSVFLQDWKPGHVFTYDDKILTNYKAGDMYRWSTPYYYHGVVNLGYETRYTLQITTYDI